MPMKKSLCLLKTPKAAKSLESFAKGRRSVTCMHKPAVTRG